METKTTNCTFCRNAFELSETRSLSVDASSRYCEECEKSAYILQHRHSLSIDISSLEEVYAITSQLALLERPEKSLYSSRHFSLTRSSPDGESYWLCYYYEHVSLDLLILLVRLRTHYNLYDMETHQDTLRFWPDYSAPQGVLAPLLERNLVGSTNEAY